ncbi:sugar kinase [Reticulibacter mediterranei]|uniref:Xylulose kinase n=1 Tax=Reticulibacter mediterranei TaxID=2778369 RepID=A0A8J3IL64_9CHLR|nr:xylulokinase [Reticulibacter mediterranei]GHO97619.1 sugar kinase [Reticulibacter mediterranei]
MALLGIDLGTSAVKVMVLDEQGHTLGIGRADYRVLAPQPGWSESDPAEWWSAVAAALRETVTPQVRIDAIGLSGQMHGLVLTDAAGEPIRPALLWSDMRAQEELERYRSLPASLLARLANPLVPGMAGPMLCWLAEHEAASYQQAAWAIQPKDWLRFRLTNEVATDPSDASATLLYDLLADSWADEVIMALGLNRRLLPPILPSGARAGTLSAQAAEALGLPAGIPVATGAADTAAAALGTGLLTPGPVQLTLGTGAQLISLCSGPQADPSGRTHLYRAADDASWYAMAAVQNAGLVLNWVRQMFNATWDEVYASAGAVPPGTDGLFFLPYLTQERPHHPLPASRGAFVGLRIDHRREHLLHSALEGVAFGIRVAFEALPTAHTTTTLRLAGGGSEHTAWRQMLADILKRDLLGIDTSAASVRGAALLAGIASDVWPDAAATAALAPHASPIAMPDEERVHRYDAIFEAYLASAGMKESDKIDG